MPLSLREMEKMRGSTRISLAIEPCFGMEAGFLTMWEFYLKAWESLLQKPRAQATCSERESTWQTCWGKLDTILRTINRTILAFFFSVKPPSEKLETFKITIPMQQNFLLGSIAPKELRQSNLTQLKISFLTEKSLCQTERLFRIQRVESATMSS